MNAPILLFKVGLVYPPAVLLHGVRSIFLFDTIVETGRRVPIVRTSSEGSPQGRVVGAGGIVGYRAPPSTGNFRVDAVSSSRCLAGECPPLEPISKSLTG
jgi:hypothetical protein